MPSRCRSDAKPNLDTPETARAPRVSCEVCGHQAHMSRASFIRHNLLGTSALCYQDARGHEGSDAMARGDDHL